jgi:hypothetical protein
VQAGPNVPDAVFDFARKHLSDRQLVELVSLVGYHWMLGRIATVFQVDLDIAQGTEVYDVGVQSAARKEPVAIPNNMQPTSEGDHRDPTHLTP